jgi:multidrug efflux system outer membrane protein
LWQAGFDAAWELDVFGRVRRGVQAADADIQAAVADRNDVLLLAARRSGANYVELRGFQRQVVIAEGNVKSQQETLDLTRVRLNAGLGTDLAVGADGGASRGDAIADSGVPESGAAVDSSPVGAHRQAARSAAGGARADQAGPRAAARPSGGRAERVAASPP